MERSREEEDFDTSGLWVPANLTLSEAAPLGDAREIARQIALGINEENVTMRGTISAASLEARLHGELHDSAVRLTRFASKERISLQSWAAQ